MYRVKSRLITKSQAPSSGCAAKEAGRSISALRNVESGLRYRRLGSPLWRVVRAGRFNQFESNSSSRTAAIGITGCINWKHPCKYHKPIQLPVILKLRTNSPPLSHASYKTHQNQRYCTKGWACHRVRHRAVRADTD